MKRSFIHIYSTVFAIWSGSALFSLLHIGGFPLAFFLSRWHVKRVFGKSVLNTRPITIELWGGASLVALLFLIGFVFCEMGFGGRCSFLENSLFIFAFYIAFYSDVALVIYLILVEILIRAFKINTRLQRWIGLEGDASTEVLDRRIEPTTNTTYAPTPIEVAPSMAPRQCPPLGTSVLHIIRKTFLVAVGVATVLVVLFLMALAMPAVGKLLERSGIIDTRDYNPDRWNVFRAVEKARDSLQEDDPHVL